MSADAGVTAVNGGVDSLQSDVLSVGTHVLPLAAAVAVLTIGWRFAKKFIR